MLHLLTNGSCFVCIYLRNKGRRLEGGGNHEKRRRSLFVQCISSVWPLNTLALWPHAMTQHHFYSPWQPWASPLFSASCSTVPSRSTGTIQACTVEYKLQWKQQQYTGKNYSCILLSFISSCTQHPPTLVSWPPPCCQHPCISLPHGFSCWENRRVCMMPPRAAAGGRMSALCWTIERLEGRSHHTVWSEIVSECVSN